MPALNDVALSGAMQQSLLSLQSTQGLINKTQSALSTGYAVNSAADNPSAYFTAQAERSRASTLSNLLDNMGEAIQTVTQAQNGVTAITTLIQQMQGVVQSARSSTTAQRDTLMTQYNQLRTQLNQTVADSNYKGTNLLQANTLTVQFDENNTSTLAIKGFTATAGTRSSFAATTVTGGLGITTAGATGTKSWGQASFSNILSTTANQLQSALNTLQAQSSTLASNLDVVTTRQTFTQSTISTLQTGADNLTLADPNEEGANMLALQTRQQLGIESLSLASQANSSILRLFGA